MNVVLDTNVYRDLVVGLNSKTLPTRAEQFRNREMANGIRSLVHPIVMHELLVNASNPASRSRYECLRAIAFLAIHCRLGGQENGLVPVAPLAAEMSRVLFNKTIDGLDDLIFTQAKICEFISELYLSNDESVVLQACYTGSVESLSVIDANFEAEFRKAFKERFFSVDPQGDGVKITMAEDGTSPNYLKDIRSPAMLGNLALDHFVYPLANSIGLTLTETQAQTYAMHVVSFFRIPLEICREMWIRVATTGFDIDHPKKNWGNCIWDMDIAAIASGIIENERVLLVTNDSMIIEACSRAGYKDNVMRTVDYCKLIGV